MNLNPFFFYFEGSDFRGLSFQGLCFCDTPIELTKSIMDFSVFFFKAHTLYVLKLDFEDYSIIHASNYKVSTLISCHCTCRLF